MKFIRSVESKIIASIGVASMLISVLKRFNIQKVLAQLILFALLVRDTDCLVFQDCKIPSVTIYVLPVLVLSYFIAEYMFYSEIEKIKRKMSDRIAKFNGILV
jgi:hypothetical protein